MPVTSESPAAEQNVSGAQLAGDLTVSQPATVMVGSATEFTQLAVDLRVMGFDATLAQLEKQRPGSDQLIAALHSVRRFVENDPDQLWFQLQTRTRLKGWEDFQSRLLKQMPKTTLVGTSMAFSNVCPGIIKSWKTGGIPIRVFQLSHDRQSLYCSSGADLWVLDFKTWQIKQRLEGLGQIVHIISHSAGDLCLVQGERYTTGKVLPNYNSYPLRVCRCQDGRELAILPEYFYGPDRGGSIGPSISPDGKFLVFAAQSREGAASLDVLDLTSGKVVTTFSPRTSVSPFKPVVIASSFLNQGKRVLALGLGDLARTFSFPDGAEDAPPFPLPYRGNLPGVMTFSADGRQLAIATYVPVPSIRKPDYAMGPEVFVWDADDGKEISRRPFGPSGAISSLALTAGGDIAVGTSLGLLSILPSNPAHKASVLQTNLGEIQQFVPSPDGSQFFIPDGMGLIRLIDPRKLTPRIQGINDDPARPAVRAEERKAGSPGKAPRGKVLGATSDGTHMISAEGLTGTIYIWDVSFKNLVRKYDLGERDLKFQFDGMTLITTQGSSNRRWMFRFQP